ncbi:glutamine ABC transporter permease [Sporomusaceae bacterium FL31]|nr:glutamine ABC transporter permease [Sporomusaceae bacterium FL31]GCE34155.1 glutamine ABC transporter permease [Sporomusaceae bacterium]
MTGPFAGFKWLAVFRDWSVFAEGFVMTIALSVLALALALLLGILFGVLGTAQWKPFRWINRVYVEFIQNTPLVIQVFFLYHGLPHLGLMLPVFSVGMFGVGIYHGAYIAEVVRAGIQAVPRGQLEAAYSQGFSYWEAMRYIILPQAKRMSYPPLTNQAVSLIKNTSVMAMVAGGDLMYHADSWASSNLYYGPAYVVTGLLYIAICFPLATYARRLERKLEVSL